MKISYASIYYMPTMEESLLGDPLRVEELLSLGVSLETITSLGPKAVTQLSAELGRFASFSYGATTAQRFMSEPHPSLALQTPIKALAIPEMGVAAVLQALATTYRLMRRY